MATIQSIIDRVTFVTKDPDRVRFTLDEILLWLNNAQEQIASLHPRAASQYVTLTLAEGARQDLRTIAPTTRWIRLHELVCNVVGDKPVGTTIRQISRPSIDFAFRSWRGGSPTATAVKEYSMDEREPFTFDVNPPVAPGTKVYALAAVKPAPITSEAGDFALADGYDIPAVDYVLFRLFSKDANDQTYSARAAGHLQAFQLAMGVETKDASVQ